ncbi:MAG: hypothetical protein RL217_1131 [Pseudomonadota bacterium]|jgi:SAM-dependent methyltransferase/Tfp pilus assembly protein PilF
MASAQLQFLPTRSREHRRLYEEASQIYNQAHPEYPDELLQQALTLAQRARALLPTHLPTLNLLARIEQQRNNYAAAKLWLEQGLQLKPHSASLLYSAGQLALAQSNLAEAEQYFTQSLQISRVATRSLNSLAHVKFLQGDFVEAFRHYRELAKTQAHNIELRSQLFAVCAKLSADFYNEELEQDLLRYLDFTDVDYGHLQNLCTTLLSHKLHLSEAGCPLDINQLAKEPLLLKCLGKFYFTNPVFERLFITLRQSILFASSAQLSISQPLLPLASALAQQVDLNEAVWYINEKEHQLVAQLESLTQKMLLLNDIAKTDIAPILLLVFMYKPLAQCQFLSQLNYEDWPDFVNQLIQSPLQEQNTLADLVKSIPSLGESHNTISIKVQKQYNENPYPRWRSVGYNQPADYALALQQHFPNWRYLLPKPGSKLQALVAGCGTGRHAIRLAKYFPKLKITALDLSYTALAYAQYQAEIHQQTTLHFIQGDILNCHALNRKFDLIECSGVLHHMHDPKQGLNALAARLKKGGIIKIALYSKTARQVISALRQTLAEHRPRDAQGMRLVREAILQKALPGNWEALLNSPDFYSLSGCRDLIFHEQEHVFDVLDLPNFLASAQLTYLGMLAPAGSENLLNWAGKQAHEISIQEWHTLEQANSDLFAGMYQFYAIKLD